MFTLLTWSQCSFEPLSQEIIIHKVKQNTVFYHLDLCF